MVTQRDSSIRGKQQQYHSFIFSSFHSAMWLLRRIQNSQFWNYHKNLINYVLNEGDAFQIDYGKNEGIL